MKLTFLLFAFLSLPFFGSAPVVAQNITCDLVLAEPIDTASVDSTISAIIAGEASEDSGQRYMCLNSPGGLVSEARRLVEFMEERTEGRWDYGITTVVLNDMECLSSCALIFMAGFNCQKNLCRTSRYIEPFAKLGFHAPEIAIDANASAATLRLVYQTAIQDLGYFASLSSNRSFIGSPVRYSGALISEVTKNSGSDYFFVSDIKHALSLDISLMGSWRHPKEMTATEEYFSLFHACDNFFWMNKLTKGFPEPNYNYDAGNYSSEVISAEILLGWRAYVHMNAMLGSGNSRWATCNIPFGRESSSNPGTFEVDDPDNMLDVFPGLYSSLSPQNEISSDDTLFWELDSKGVISLDDAWDLVSKVIHPSEYWLFWSMDTPLVEVGLR